MPGAPFAMSGVAGGDPVPALTTARMDDHHFRGPSQFVTLGGQIRRCNGCGAEGYCEDHTGRRDRQQPWHSGSLTRAGVFERLTRRRLWRIRAPITSFDNGARHRLDPDQTIDDPLDPWYVFGGDAKRGALVLVENDAVEFDDSVVDGNRQPRTRRPVGLFEFGENARVDSRRRCRAELAAYRARARRRQAGRRG